MTFGEIMLRLSPPGFERFFQSPVLQATFGGGEANVAVSLAQFGLDSYYVTRVPANPIGDGAVRALRGEGVRTDYVQRGGERLGIYFAETGASQRASTVVYDRAHASIGRVKRGDVPWAEIFAGASWFHTTGITPALGESVADATHEAVAAARAAGATVSLDLNYRAKLWSKERAREVMRPLAAQADVLIANEEDIQASLGLEVAGADVVRRPSRRRRLPRRGRARGAGVRREAGGHHAARELLGEPQRLERRAVRRADGRVPPGPALRRHAGRSHRRRRQFRGRADLRAGDRARRGGGAALRRRGQRAEADDSRRLQPRDGRRSRSALPGRRQRPRAALVPGDPAAGGVPGLPGSATTNA